MANASMASVVLPARLNSPFRTRAHFSIRASASSSKDLVLKPFFDKNALKIISGLQNFDKERVKNVVIAADKGGATHVDIACDQELVKLALSLTSLPVCVSSVNPSKFLPAVESGAQMVEIGNYDSFYEMGIQFSSEDIINLTRETRRILPEITLSVTVPSTLCFSDQVILGEQLEKEGADIIQTEGLDKQLIETEGLDNKFHELRIINHGLGKKARATLNAAFYISQKVRIPVMCSSGLNSLNASYAKTFGASGVGVGSAVNKLNDLNEMIEEVRKIALELGLQKSSVPLYNLL